MSTVYRFEVWDQVVYEGPESVFRDPIRQAMYTCLVKAMEYLESSVKNRHERATRDSVHWRRERWWLLDTEMNRELAEGYVKGDVGGVVKRLVDEPIVAV